MKKYILFFIILWTIIQCTFTTEPQKITVEDQNIKLAWIKFQDETAWYLPEYESKFNSFTYKHECFKINIYPTKMMFIYEINGEKMIQEIDSGPSDNPWWIWKEN